MKTNPMKAKLLAGEPAFGCSVMVPSPQMVEMVGHAGFDWVLIDCGDVIVHLFRPEVRSFYNLERMWAFGDEEGSA